MAHKPLTTVIISDHRLLSDLLQIILKDVGLEVVATFTAVEAGASFVISNQPTLVILEMMMPTLSTFAPISADFPEPIVLLDCAGAFQAVKNISEQSPTTRILMLTGERHPYNFARGLEYGAHGIASKVDSLDDMLTILRCILAGETGILSARMERLVAEYLELPIPSLSDLEKRVLELVQFGMENSEIARELGYARKTVRNTLNIINQKFGTKNRFQAAALAEELGLIGWPSS